MPASPGVWIAGMATDCGYLLERSGKPDILVLYWPMRPAWKAAATPQNAVFSFRSTLIATGR